jgi:uncharacterized membrane protein YidH (DUF202 family)
VSVDITPLVPNSSQPGQAQPQDGTVEPDYRFTLANERTFLAWQRTSLGLLAAAVAAVQFMPELSIHDYAPHVGRDGRHTGNADRGDWATAMGAG